MREIQGTKENKNNQLEPADENRGAQSRQDLQHWHLAPGTYQLVSQYSLALNAQGTPVWALIAQLMGLRHLGGCFERKISINFCVGRMLDSLDPTTSRDIASHGRSTLSD